MNVFELINIIGLRRVNHNIGHISLTNASIYAI